jgi:ABC-type transport system involved in multi-copper enzyme maturation permease subunit
MRNILAVAGVVLRCWSRRKDAYILMLILALVLYGVSSMDVLATGGSSLYLYDVGLLLTWFLGWIAAIHVGASELPGEESRGTVFLLLAKPLHRAELIAGKWLGAWVTVAACTLVFHAVALTAALLAGVRPPAGALAQMCLLHLASLSVLTALAIAFSTRLNRDAAISLTVTVALAVFLLVPKIPKYLHYTAGWRSGMLEGLYYLLPHLELFDLRRRVLHGYGAIPGGVLGIVAVYGAVWTGILLLVAWFAYRRRRFQRDRLLE